MSGIVYLVGAGPGDPGLLTVRGKELLGSCDVIATDALANPEIVRMAREGNPQVEVHEVGKRGGDQESTSQDEINALLVQLGREGKRVVRLKGGDPFVFGRGSEEAQALAAAGVPFEVVPGVTAGIAAPAYAGIPVTHRGVATSLTFVTGHEDPSKPDTQTDWGALARAGGTIVLYMGVKTLPRIAEALIKGGRSAETPAAAVQWGTHAKQRTVTSTLGALHEAIKREGLTAPVITVIGDVVALREEISWFDRRPLSGKRIVVTRATVQAGATRAALAALGAEVLELPALRIEPLITDVAEKLRALNEGDWLVFTSQNAVKLTWKALREADLDARALAGVRIACVGRATSAALLEHGISADAIPARFVAEGVLEVMATRSDVGGRHVLYVAGEGARGVLPMGLRSLGCDVEVVNVYRSVSDGRGADALRAALAEGRVDAVTFASASAVRGYIEAVGLELAQSAPAISIGPITSEALRGAGIHVTAEAREASVASLTEATVTALTS